MGRLFASEIYGAYGAYFLGGGVGAYYRNFTVYYYMEFLW